MQLLSDSAVDEAKAQRVGLRSGRNGIIEDAREQYSLQLERDYFAKQPTYTALMIQHIFRATHDIFNRIAETLEQNEAYV